MTDKSVTRRRLLRASGLAGVFGLAGCLRLTETSSGQGATGTGTAGTPVGTDTAAGTATAQPTTGVGTDGTATDTAADGTGTDTAGSDTETTTQSQNGVTYPPGVSEDEVSTTLVLSHRQAVAETTRTVETKFKFERRRAKIGDTGMHIRGEHLPETFVDDGEMYQRYSREGQTIYGYRTDIPSEYRREALTGVGVLRGLIRGANFRPVGTQTANGETSILIEADEIVDQAVLQDTRHINRYYRRSEFPIEGISGSGVVSQNGLIEELGAFLETSSETGEFFVRTSDVGSTTVSKPSWTGTAKEQEAEFELGLVDDGEYILLEQVSGQSLDTRFEIDAFDGGAYFESNYTGSSSPGSRFYLYQTDEQNDRGERVLGVSKGSRPAASPTGTWSTNSEVHMGIGPIRVIRGGRVA